MKFIIRRGKHRAKPFRFAIWWNRRFLRRRIMFLADCKYDLPGHDRDYNKLFGIGFFSFNRVPHHVDSARFGWYHDKITDRIVVATYTYINGQRSWTNLCYCNVGWEYEMRIDVFPDEYIFTVSQTAVIIGQLTVPKIHHKKLSYLLGPYFGGTQVAPQSMTLLISAI